MLAAENCRRQVEAPDDSEVLYLHVMAPVMISYVEWILREAVRTGKKRLYFLARDAWPMYQVACKLCKSRELQLECRYLKVSRYALRRAEYHLLGQACVDRICIGGINVTLDKVLDRAGLNEAEKEDALSRLHMQQQRDRVLTYHEVMALKERISAEKEILQAIDKHAGDAYPATLQYLEGEGLLEELPYALVDSGWVGTLQQTMQRLLQTRKPGLQLEGYYFGLYELPSGVDATGYHGFYFDPLHGLRRKVHFSNCLFETVFSSPDGMTMGYEKGTGSPIESQQKNANADRLLRFDILLSRFTDEYAKWLREENEEPCLHPVKLCERLLRPFMGNPEDWEAECFGCLHFCDDVLESGMQEVALELNTEELRNQHFVRKALIMHGIKKGELHESAWIEGSVVRNGRNIRRNLWNVACYKYFVYLRKLWKSFKTR